MRSQKRNRPATHRDGAIGLLTGFFLLFVLLGLVAIAVDVGYLMLTHTELQAVSDAATLSGGTEILPGLGDDPVAPSTVVTNGTAQAVDYASRNRNGDRASSYVSGPRDVRFGWARLNAGRWDLHWGSEIPSVGGYNLIGVAARRDQDGSTNGDGPLPTFFARFLGHSFADVTADAAAVIMPATGISIPPGSPLTSNVIPFALREQLWDRYEDAQEYYDQHNGELSDPIEGILWKTGEPLFGHFTTDQHGDPVFVRDFADEWDCGCQIKDETSTPEPPNPGPDGLLEIDIYPRDEYTAGNLGTVDIGGYNNSTADIERQILDGVNEDDLSYYDNNEFLIPTDTNGDTGLSAGIKDELDAIAGQCRVFLLFNGMESPGNTSVFHLTKFAGIRVMHSELTGNMDYKHFKIQKCNATLPGGIGDYDTPPGDDTTVFTPLILVE